MNAPWFHPDQIDWQDGFNPLAKPAFRAVNERASCRYMKMITPAKLLASLEELRDEVVVDPEIARRARGAVERMIAIGTSGGGGE